MADVEVKYRGQTIRAMSASGTEVLHTKEKYCDDDITIDYTSPGGGGANLQTKSVSYTPDESGISDTILPDPGYDGLDEVDVTVDAIPDTYVGSGVPQKSSADLTAVGATVMVPAGMYALPSSKTVQSGTEGTPTASKGAVSNHIVDVTPSVTNAAGYISGGTQTGTPVTVSASELVSGSQTITVNDTYDVTDLAEVVVNVSGNIYNDFSGGNIRSLISHGTEYILISDYYDNCNNLYSMKFIDSSSNSWEGYWFARGSFYTGLERNGTANNMYAVIQAHALSGFVPINYGTGNEVTVTLSALGLVSHPATRPLSIFCTINTSGNPADMATFEFYGLNILDSSMNFVKKFVPWLENGTPGIKDLVSGNIYYNGGSGAFDYVDMDGVIHYG